MLKAPRWLKGSTIWLACVSVFLGLGLSMLLSDRTMDPAHSSRLNSSQLSPLLSVEQPVASDLVGREPISPITPPSDLDTRKVALGDRLFHDPQLSGNNQISCASCHRQDSGGADIGSRSLGFEGQLSAFNAPTVWNSSLNFRQFWDGRVATLEDQINGPILDPREMNTSWESIVSKLSQNGDYVRTFQQLYLEGIEPAAIRDAIATYERSLVTPDARFDQYLRGDQAAISAEEKAGYQKFKDYGCVACHQGVNIGGNLYQSLGVMRDFFADRGNIQPADLGRMNISGRARDRYVFKVPGLRNIELTAPYLHDGSIETLEEVVAVMGQYQLGREIPPDDITLLVKFLRTLTGKKGAIAL